MSDCIMCGIDSSTTKTGISVFKNGNLEEYMLIDISKEKKETVKIDKMSLEILSKLNTYNPQIVVAELTSMTRNAVTQRTLTMILGVIMSWCLQNNAEYVFLRASEWRKLISDEKKPRKREELKQWAINTCKALYNIDVADDVAEAILVAQARINQFKEK